MKCNFYFSFPGSAQLILNVTKFVEYTNCNTTVLLPCIVFNIEATGLEELFVKWKFGGKYFFTYDGAQREPKPHSNFSSAKIFPDDLLKGNASLEMDKEQAVPGNYTCEVTELSRQGDTVVELKYRLGKISMKTSLLFVRQQPDPVRNGAKWDKELL